MSRVWTQQPQIESPLLDSRQQVINGFGRIHGTPKVATTNLFTRSVGSLGVCQLQPAGASTNYAVYPINPITIGTGDFTYYVVFEPLVDESASQYIYALGSNTTFGFAAKHASSGNGAGIYIGGAIVNPNIPHLAVPGVHKVVVRRVNGVIYVNADNYSGSVASSTSVSSISSLVLGSYTTSGGTSFYFGCKYYLAGIQLGAWSEAQAKAFVNNPWQIFQPLSSRIFVGPAAAGSLTLSADSGAYALTGVNANLTASGSYSVSAEAGSFSVGGQAASFAVSLQAASGSASVTGQASNYGLNALASSGAYTLNGVDAAFAIKQLSSSGSVAVTGTDAKFAIALSVASGAYSQTGQPATLTGTGLTSFTVSAEAGALSLAGASAAFDIKQASSSGSYTQTGSAAAFAIVVPTESGSYTLTGADAALLNQSDYALLADVGAYLVTGSDADLTYHGVIARPSSDTTPGAWHPSVGTDLYAMIDEVVADDADYIYANSATTCTLALNPVADPLTSSGQVVSYRAWSPTADGLTVRLMQGATTIATWTHAALPVSETTYTQSLSPTECDAITNYSGLSIEFESL